KIPHPNAKGTKDYKKEQKQRKTKQRSLHKNRIDQSGSTNQHQNQSSSTHQQQTNHTNQHEKTSTNSHQHKNRPTTQNRTAATVQQNNKQLKRHPSQAINAKRKAAATVQQEQHNKQ
ncbi:unnamed protein product, partial [Ilex paraguariensis]